MVKPQQVLRWTIFRIVVKLLYRSLVLFQRVAAGSRAVETDPFFFGLVIVIGCPVGTWFVFEPWTRTIVMVPSHDVVKAERCHVFDQDLAGSHHDVLHTADHFGVVVKSHTYPFAGDDICGKGMVPCQP